MTKKENVFLAKVFRKKSPEELLENANKHGLKKTLGPIVYHDQLQRTTYLL